MLIVQAAVIVSLHCGPLGEATLMRTAEGRYDLYEGNERRVSGLRCVFAGEDARLVTCTESETSERVVFSTTQVTEMGVDRRGHLKIETLMRVGNVRMPLNACRFTLE